MKHRDGVDLAATVAAYRAAAERAGPDASALAGPLWDRLDSDRWTLEWQLPLWLGGAFGLDPRVARRLATGDVLGLASIRLADDLADGEVPAGDVAAARRLASALYDAALVPYRELLAGDSPFWSQLDGWMAAWRLATDRAALGPAGRGLSGQLAARGAPLRIPALAVCLLTEREPAFDTLERCLDHALRAMVRYDHACDWREDLAAGRWNAFANGERDPRRLEADLLSGGLIGPYFAEIDLDLERSIALALELDVAGLAGHLASRRASVAAEGRSLESRYRALGDAATQLVFGQFAT